MTRTMFPMVRIATNTHCTTCWGGKPGQHLPALQGCPSPEGRWGGGRPACWGQRGLWGHGCPASATSLDTKEMEWSQQCLGCVSGVRPAGPIPAPGSSIPVPPWGPAGHVPPQDPPGPPQGPPFPIPPWGHLQPFGSVDGPERTEHPQHPQDFHHGDGAGPGGSQGGAEGRLLPPALHTSARLPVPPVNAACALPQDGGATCPGAGLVGAPLGLPLGLPADWGTQAPGPGPPGGGRTTPPLCISSWSPAHALPTQPCHFSPASDKTRTPDPLSGPGRPSPASPCPQANSRWGPALAPVPAHSRPMEMRDTATTTRSRMLK